MKNLVKIFKALSDPNRIRILKMLEVRPLCVCEITDILNLANSTVSKHLSILKDVELIDDKKEGKWVNYHLNEKAQLQYAAQLQPLIKQWLTEAEQIHSDKIKVIHTNREFICGISGHREYVA